MWLVLVIQLRQKQDSNPGAIAPEPGPSGVKKGQTQRQAGSPYQQQPHRRRRRVADHEYETKPAGLGKKSCAFHNALPGTIYTLYSQRQKDEDRKATLLRSFKTCEPRGSFPCWQRGWQPRPGQTPGTARWPAVLLAPPPRQTRLRGALVLGEPQLAGTRRGHFFV